MHSIQLIHFDGQSLKQIVPPIERLDDVDVFEAAEIPPEKRLS